MEGRGGARYGAEGASRRRLIQDTRARDFSGELTQTRHEARSSGRAPTRPTSLPVVVRVNPPLDLHPSGFYGSRLVSAAAAEDAVAAVDGNVGELTGRFSRSLSFGRCACPRWRETAFVLVLG